MLLSKYEQVLLTNGPPTEKIELQAIVDGKKETVIYAWWTPVTDRTLADCVYGNKKGCIDSTLLNRLESNAEFIKHALDDIGQWYIQPRLVDFTWRREMYIYFSDFDRLQNNIAGLRASGIVTPETPETLFLSADSLPHFTVINNWEECLLRIYLKLKELSYIPQRKLGAFVLGDNYWMQVLRR